MTFLYVREQSPLAGNTGLYLSGFVSPNSPVDYTICGLMQERVYIVQSPVSDTSRCDQRLELSSWHVGKHKAQNVINEGVRQKDITLNNC